MEIRRRDFNLICKLGQSLPMNLAKELLLQMQIRSNAKFAVGKDVLLKYVP